MVEGSGTKTRSTALPAASGFEPPAEVVKKSQLTVFPSAGMTHGKLPSIPTASLYNPYWLPAVNCVEDNVSPGNQYTMILSPAEIVGRVEPKSAPKRPFP